MHLYQFNITMIFGQRNKFTGKIYVIAKTQAEATKMAYIYFKSHSKVKITFIKEINTNKTQILEGISIPFVSKEK